MTTEQKFEILEEIACGNLELESFIDGAVCVGGYSDEVAERILFYWTGWRTFEGYLESEEWGEED